MLQGKVSEFIDTGRHCLQFSDLDASDYAYEFERAALIKKNFKTYEKHHSLADRTLAMIFKKAFTRTWVSFKACTYQLGVHRCSFV